MSIKVENLINLDRLTQYDGLIKNKIKKHSDIQASDTVSGHVKVDTELSDTSTNPVQNKAVKNALDSKVPITRTVNGKALSSNISLSASDVGADPSGSSNSALSSAKSYTDAQVSTVNNTLTSHTGNTSNPHSVTKAQVGLGNVENKSSATIRGELTKTNVTNALGYTPYTPNEVDNKIATLETNIDWKETVATYSDIATTYPNPVDGWTVNVKDTDYTYRYNGTSWIAISANVIPKATNSIDGLLTKEDHTKYEDANSKKHTHDNKAVIDGITSTLVSNWNAAKTHADSAHARTDATKVEKSSTNGNIKINGTETVVYTHPSGTNPHGTTQSDVGLGNVNNTADKDKYVKGVIDYANTSLGIQIGYSGAGLTVDEATHIAAYAENGHKIKDLSFENLKTKLGLNGAEPNQNAFSNIVVGSTTIEADTKTDTLTLVAGSNVTLTPDATNDKITITSTNTDTKVTQTAISSADYTNWRSLIWGASNSGTEGFTPSTVTDGVYTCNTLSVQPSSGTIRANVFKGNLSGNATTATKWTTPRTLSLTGAVTGSATIDGSGNVSLSTSVNHTHTKSQITDLQTSLDNKLDKTSYEYNKELSLGSSGKVCIGVFPCYDSNISIDIKSTTSITYHGTLIIATQNINASGGGSYTATVYGDEDNKLASSIKIQYVSGSNAFSIYINLPPWSKNILHIQCVALAGSPSNIATIIDSIPSTATIIPTNAFTHTHNYAGSSSAGGAANTAVKLSTARTISLTGSVVGSGSFDGSGDLSISTTTNHTHDDRYYTESEINTKLNAKLNTSLKGTANGLAELDSNGRVPSNQLPSYVDDVIEGYLYNSKFYKESAHTTEITGETGKIYIDLTSNKTYRWSGSAFSVISETLALGETSSTAYRGDRGKIAYDHSQAAHAPSNAEVNQNAFSNVTVGSTTIVADSKTDTLTLVAGSNVTITPDATNDKITISSTDTNTWRGIQDNLTSTSTTESLSANQGRLLANGSARDNTKLSLSGGNVTGKTTYSGGLAITSASENKNVQFLLGIKAFADGGDVEYIASSDVISLIGASPSNHTHNTLSGYRNIDGIISNTLDDGLLKYIYNVYYGTPDLFPCNDNANSIIHMSKHYGDYDSQLGFSSNGLIYYRSCNGESLSGKSWEQIAFTSSNVASANKLATARTISLTGSVTGSGSFDGSGNLSITTTTNHTHSYLPLTGGIVTGATQFNNYLKLNAWPGYGTGTANFWYDANNKFVEIQNATDLKLSGTKVSKDGHTHNYAGSSSAGGSANSAIGLTQHTITSMDALDAFSSSDFTMKFATASNCDIGWVSKDGLIISLPWNSGYGAQIAIDDNFNWMGFRSKSNGTWNNWSVLLSSTNYTSYVTPTNIGAAPSSHTHTKSQITDFPSSLPASDVYAWAKASSKPSYSWDEITAKPSSFTPASHTHTSVNNITPEWSGSVAWADTGWIAAWNSDGTKIKALDKNSFAPANHTHNYLPISGGTMTGQIQKSGVSSSWIDGRSNAMIRMNSISGYSPFASIKTTNGSWEIGAYDSPGYIDELVFSYCTDANFNAGNNSITSQIGFLENGHILGNLDGNASTATSATKLNDITASDEASSTDTWRRVWFSYDDNTTGRPAYSNNLCYQSSTGSLKAITFIENGTALSNKYVPLSGNSTVNGAITFGMNDGYGIRTNTNNYGRIGDSTNQFYEVYSYQIYEDKTLLSNKYAPISHTHNYAGSTSEGGAANYLSVQQGNEINFTNATPVADLWFNYRNADNGSTSNDTAIATYRFGNKNGSTSGVTLFADSFTGNSASASRLATARTISLIGSVTGSGTFDGSGDLTITTTTNHTHAYLPLSGGIISGSVVHNTKNNQYASDGGTWISGKTSSNSPLVFLAPITKCGERYDPYMWGQNVDGDVWNFCGGANNTIGFAGFNSYRTTNETDWMFSIDITSGEVSSSSNITAPEFVGKFTGTADSSTNADKLDGYHGSLSQSANTYVLRDGNGYIYTNYINSNTSNSENPTISQIIVTNGSDNFYRKASLEHLKNSLGSMPPSSHSHTIGNIDGLQNSLDSKLNKITYEYNKELSLGSSGKICVGTFNCYDTNITVEIKSTTNVTYSGILIIATQNARYGEGTFTAVVYGDEDNSLTNLISIERLSGSGALSIYINFPPWSKNILHIQCVAPDDSPTNIATVVDSIPSTATIVPVNAYTTHPHSWLNTNNSLTYGASGLQYFNQYTSITSGADVNANPTSEWYHIIRMNHGSGYGYFVDLATGINSNDMCYRRIESGIDNGWVRLLDSANYKTYCTPANIGAAPASHTHSYLPLSGGTVTGETQFNNYLKLNAWPGYGTGTANFWYDANNKFVEIQNATDLKLSGTKVSKDGHTHNYAGSSSAGGSATSAVKLDSSAGSATQPIYFSDGKPVSCAYSLGKSVPSDAVFTDTVYTHPTTAGNKHIPSGGSSGQILRWSADGTAVWGDDNNAELNNKTSVTIVRWS